MDFIVHFIENRTAYANDSKEYENSQDALTGHY